MRDLVPKRSAARGSRSRNAAGADASFAPPARHRFGVATAKRHGTTRRGLRGLRPRPCGRGEVRQSWRGRQALSQSRRLQHSRRRSGSRSGRTTSRSPPGRDRLPRRVGSAARRRCRLCGRWFPRRRPPNRTCDSHRIRLSMSTTEDPGISPDRTHTGWSPVLVARYVMSDSFPTWHRAVSAHPTNARATPQPIVCPGPRSKRNRRQAAGSVGPSASISRDERRRYVGPLGRLSCGAMGEPGRPVAKHAAAPTVG
jgi:hypothetical protein